MGGAVSAGRDNEELVDNLCYEGYIHKPHVEKVFREIDRRDYMTFEEGEDMSEAYEDHAWRKGNLHLSAPCIYYTRAVEALKLEKGVSFLNIGSGTGYLSIMAGLIIGPYGINHGIELHEDNVEYANNKLVEFREKSEWYDPLSFCDPIFVVGNGLLVSPGNILYDRIYCGAGCPLEHALLMKNMINIGGLLVMPLEHQLECICRTGETEWEAEVILPSVSFASLILPSKESLRDLTPVEIFVEPRSLKEMCRLEILKQLGRVRFQKISELPLPKHLQEYVSHYKVWGPPPSPVKILCPIDDAKKAERESKREAINDRHENSANGHAPGRNVPSFAHAVDLNGRRVLVCNFNGVTFQVPVNGSSGEESNADSDDDERQSQQDPDLTQSDNETGHDNEGQEASLSELEMSQSFEDDHMDTDDMDSNSPSLCKRRT